MADEKIVELEGGHWDSEDFKQRMRAKEWAELLLAERDLITYRGNLVRLKARNLGFGVVEVSKSEGGKGG